MRILLVEDDTNSRTVLNRLLQRWGFEVAAAEDLEHGLEFLHSEHFDGLLSDIALPDGTGYALVSEARRQAEPMLAIAMSDFRYPEEVHVPKLTGFDYHLDKPLDCDRLRDLLVEGLKTFEKRQKNNTITYGG
jgi:DNA-binding NtrC family response regulator